jgi:hypothetical protein
MDHVSLFLLSAIGGALGYIFLCVIINHFKNRRIDKNWK